MSTKPKLYILRGVPGSGKTTIAEAMLKNRLVEAHHEQDHYFIGKDGKYNYDRSKIQIAVKYCQECVRDSLSNGKNTVVANSFIKLWTVDKFVAIAQEYNASVVILKATGNFVNTFGIPENVIKNQRREYEPYPGEVQLSPEL
ncbi:AAA family ATPase [Flavobacterium sp.]|jgi:hypothetical protein|uniref:AAA family ATPase n=1 Tax=Flavobacterium sp. TaxID=239 RepID=UPI0037C19DC9